MIQVVKIYNYYQKSKYHYDLKDPRKNNNLLLILPA
jgi:hypothetical protein